MGATSIGVNPSSHGRECKRTGATAMAAAPHSTGLDVVVWLVRYHQVGAQGARGQGGEGGRGAAPCMLEQRSTRYMCPPRVQLGGRGLGGSIELAHTHASSGPRSFFVTPAVLETKHAAPASGLDQNR